MTLMFILILIIWLSIGATGFIYWWTTEHDFTTNEILLMILCGFVGPFAWVIGYSVHGGSIVFVKKRRK